MESRTFAPLLAVVSIWNCHHCKSVPINVGCENTDSQIQGDENAAALTAQRTFPVIKLVQKERATPPPPPEEIWGNDINDDGNGSPDEDCPPETCIGCFSFLRRATRRGCLAE